MSCHDVVQLCGRRDGRVESGRLHSPLAVPLPVSLFASDDLRTLLKYSPRLLQEANVNKEQYFPAGLTPDGAERHGRTFVTGRLADAYPRRPSTQRSYAIVCCMLLCISERRLSYAARTSLAQGNSASRQRMTVQDTRTRTRSPDQTSHGRPLKYSPLRYIGQLYRLEHHARGAFHAAPWRCEYAVSCHDIVMAMSNLAGCIHH